MRPRQVCGQAANLAAEGPHAQPYSGAKSSASDAAVSWHRRLSPCGPPRYTSPAGAAVRHLQSRNSVRIKAIEPIAVSLPMKKPVKMAGETVSRADNVLVRVESDAGAVGWGEAAS